jgi:hypothetical protein
MCRKRIQRVIQHTNQKNNKNISRFPGITLGLTTNCVSLQLRSHSSSSTTKKSKFWLYLIVETTFLPNSRWFLLFHKTQTFTSQISFRKDRCARRPPVASTNLIRWSNGFWGPAEEKPIQRRTDDHKEPKVPHVNNKCWADSMPPHPDTQKWASGEIMPRDTKLAVVGNLSRRSLHSRFEVTSLKSLSATSVS